MPDIGDGGMEAANHIAMYVPMQLSYMLCSCTPKPLIKKKIKKKKKRKKSINFISLMMNPVWVGTIF